MSYFGTSRNKKLVFTRYSSGLRYKSDIDAFISRCSDCGATTSTPGATIFDGITFIDALNIQGMLRPFGCQTKIEDGSGHINEKEQQLNAFFSNGGGSMRCIRCGSTNREPNHGFFGNHPSRWRCKDCGWSWEY